MKKAFLLFFIVNVFFSSYASNKFDIRIANIEDEKGTSIIEFQNFYIISGYIKKGSSFGNYLVKLDKQGNLIEDTIIFMGTLNLCAVKLDDKFAVFRENSSSYPSNTSFEYTLFDTSLNVIYNKKLRLPDSLYASRYYVKMNKDSSFMISGVLNKPTTSQPVAFEPFIYKVSKAGDSLNLRVISNLNNSFERAFNVRKVNKKYYVFMSSFSLYTLGSILVLDENLNTLDTLDIPNDLYDQYSTLIMPDSTFLMCTLRFSSSQGQIYISKIDTLSNVLTTKAFGNTSTFNYPAYQNSLSKKGNDIFLVFNVDFPLSNPFFGTGKPSFFKVQKLDENLNVKWEKKYGGDAFYHVYNVLATSDGGCIVIGNVNDTINHNLNRDIFVLKYDSMGLISWTNNITATIQEIKVYPNPSSNNLHIELKNTHQQIENIKLIDIQGRLVYEQPIHSLQATINVSYLSNGIYFIEGLTSEGDYFRQKFIKQ